MFFRKIYLRVRFFLHSTKEMTGKIVLIAIFLILFYAFINNYLMEKIIVGSADTYRVESKCENAIKLYDVAYFYYKLNHYTKENQQIYFDIPYKKAVCYLAENKRKESINSMIQGLTVIQEQCGIFSPQTAYFIRKYLVDYYISNNNVRLAKRAYDNLIVIYKNIGCSDSEMSDMIRLAGDIYYEQKKYPEAISLYEQAYDLIAVQNDIDYDVFSRIVNRICDYKLQNGQKEDAIKIYKSSIALLDSSRSVKPELAADMLIKLGDIYGNENSLEAMNAYERAVYIVKSLPKSSPLRQNLLKYLTTLKELYVANNQYTKAQDIETEIIKEKRFSFMF